MTVEEYLKGEESGVNMQDYIAGAIWNPAPTDQTHDMVRNNLGAMLYRSIGLEGNKPFFSMHGQNVKVRLQPRSGGFVYFYHADMAIACDPTDNHGYPWRERPTVLFEVVSENTRQTDEREKRLAYLQFASLEAYVLIEQNRMEAVIERRTLEGWRREKLNDPKSTISLPFLDLELPLAELYAGVTLPA